MLCGFPPFFEEDNASLFKKIQNCEFDFPDEYWKNISDSAKELIRLILVRDPN
jgi:calcium/calmodulin-dependent protein kinase I